MTMTDPIADMLTRIRNGQMAKKNEVLVPFSKFKFRIAEILKQEGYISSIEQSKDMPGIFKVGLKYSEDGSPMITFIKRMSKPGHRSYRKKSELPRVLNDYGIAIVSTSKGLMTNKQARKLGFGGEVLCTLY